MSVKRYRMSYRDGIREDDGTLIWPADASKPMVLAEHYDAACAERDALRDALGYIDTSLGVHLLVTEDGEFDAAIRNTKRSIVALAARVERLEGALQTVRVEIGALIARPELRVHPSDVPEKLNEADRECVAKAFNVAKAALSPQAEKLEKEGV